MGIVLLSLMLMAVMPPSGQLTPGTPAQQTPVPVRTEKLTPDEQKQLKDAKADMADAQAKADAASKAQRQARAMQQPRRPAMHR